MSSVLCLYPAALRENAVFGLLISRPVKQASWVHGRCLGSDVTGEANIRHTHASLCSVCTFHVHSSAAVCDTGKTNNRAKIRTNTILQASEGWNNKGLLRRERYYVQTLKKERALLQNEMKPNQTLNTLHESASLSFFLDETQWTSADWHIYWHNPYSKDLVKRRDSSHADQTPSPRTRRRKVNIVAFDLLSCVTTCLIILCAVETSQEAGRTGGDANDSSPLFTSLSFVLEWRYMIRQTCSVRGKVSSGDARLFGAATAARRPHQSDLNRSPVGFVRTIISYIKSSVCSGHFPSKHWYLLQHIWTLISRDRNESIPMSDRTLARLAGVAFICLLFSPLLGLLTGNTQRAELWSHAGLTGGLWTS